MRPDQTSIFGLANILWFTDNEGWWTSYSLWMEQKPGCNFFLLLYAYKWIIFKEKRKLLLGKRHIIFVSKLPGNMHNEWCWMRKQLSQVLPFKPFVYIEWRVFWSLLCKYHKQSIGNNFNVNWDIFQGDGGGPLVITNDAGGSVLVGIVSYGVP